MKESFCPNPLEWSGNHNLPKNRGFVWGEANGGEIDFGIKEGMKATRRIQVWYEDPSVHSIPARETAPFRESKADNLLVTNDREDVVSEGPSKIRLVPITRFLLGL